MSTILKALRRLEEEEAKGASAKDRATADTNAASSEELRGRIIAEEAAAQLLAPKTAPRARRSQMIVAAGSALAALIGVAIGYAWFSGAFEGLDDSDPTTAARPVTENAPPLAPQPPIPAAKPPQLAGDPGPAPSAAAPAPTPSPTPRSATARAARAVPPEPVEIPEVAAAVPPRAAAVPIRREASPAAKIAAPSTSELESKAASDLPPEPAARPKPSSAPTPAAAQIAVVASPKPRPAPREVQAPVQPPARDSAAEPRAPAASPRPKPADVRPSVPPPVERIDHRGLPDVDIIRTSWHPTPDRRSAKIRVVASDEVLTLREGDAVGGLIVQEITPSSVLFKAGEVEIRRKVGPAR